MGEGPTIPKTLVDLLDHHEHRRCDSYVASAYESCGAVNVVDNLVALGS